MLIKAGAGGTDLSFLRPKMWKAIEILGHYYREEELVITETNKGTHLNHSKHYQNLAIDVRKLTNNGRYTKMREKLNAAGFDCVEEKTHYHIEYDPK